MKDLHLKIPARYMLLLALCLLFLPWLGLTLFYSKGEPREAIVAVSMLQSGDWLLPLSYGADMPFKPPLLAWLIAAFAWLFNGGVVNEYIARMPSAVAAIAMLMGIYAWGRRCRDTRFGLLLAFTTAFSFEVFRAAVACRVDMVLTACIVGAILLMHYLYEFKGAHRAWLYVAVIALLTLATLTKGPVGALLPCLVMGCYRLLRRDKFWRAFLQLLGLAIAALAIASLWYVFAAQRSTDGEFLSLVYEENIGRLTGTMSYDSHLKPFWYNFVTLITGLLPWTILLLIACFWLRGCSRPTALTKSALLSLVAAVVIVGFYCIPSSKRSVYLLPAYPFICYGICCVLGSFRAAKATRIFAWIIAVLAVLGPVALVVLSLHPVGKMHPAPMPWWGYGILLVSIACGLWWMCKRRHPLRAIMASIWAIYIAYLAVGMPMILNPSSDKDYARQLAESGADVRSLEVVRFHHYYSLNYYMGDRIRPCDDIEQAKQLPAGTILLMPEYADTTALKPYYTISKFIPRTADFREPVLMAVRKP